MLCKPTYFPLTLDYYFTYYYCYKTPCDVRVTTVTTLNVPTLFMWALRHKKLRSKFNRKLMSDAARLFLESWLHPPPLQAWTTERCWSRWSEVIGCPARRTAPRLCTSWWYSAGSGTRRRGPPSSTCRPFWRTTSLPPSRSTSRGITSEHLLILCPFSGFPPGGATFQTFSIILWL